MSLVSIIVPVYRVEKYLCRCVDSILNQTFSDFELILVDDGSPDNCGSMCDEYASRDNRVHVIHKENGGLSEARNAGIDWIFKNSDSKWITFIDSDDWVHFQYLELLVGLIKKFDAQISMCNLLRTDEFNIDACKNKKCFEIAEKKKPEDALFRNGEIAAYACGRIYDRELFRKNRFPVGRKMEDLYLIPSIMMSVEQVVCTDEELYFYFNNSEGITGMLSLSLYYDAIYSNKKNIKLFSKKKDQAYSYLVNHYLNLISSCYHMIVNKSLILEGKSRKRALFKMKCMGKIACIRYGRLADLNNDATINSLLSFSILFRIYWKFIRKRNDK